MNKAHRADLDYVYENPEQEEEHRQHGRGGAVESTTSLEQRCLPTLVVQGLLDIKKVVLGLSLQYVRVEFLDGSSVIVLPRAKETTSMLVEGLRKAGLDMHREG